MAETSGRLRSAEVQLDSASAGLGKARLDSAQLGLAYIYICIVLFFLFLCLSLPFPSSPLLFLLFLTLVSLVYVWVTARFARLLHHSPRKIPSPGGRNMPEIEGEGGSVPSGGEIWPRENDHCA